ncbi:GGDEF domain-containing protein [Allokutzneria albata]|uniref:Diguanylate cyclase (GGDEF) domain-containing protein n=1 Tax=Allokutzneria albata TaxID=211114 RepID=A0A1G9ZEC1_ALLAB|nr:GGDEF domain-containing protein [Allokutzneria albata]SDN19678.1 diguanylate cyclase (GGDEF) domain-containing protein [Allokutzneria albata]
MRNLKTVVLVVLGTLVAVMVALHLSDLPPRESWRVSKLLQLGLALVAVAGFAITAVRASGVDRYWRVSMAVAAAIRLTFCVWYVSNDLSGGTLKPVFTLAPAPFAASTLFTLGAVLALIRYGGSPSCHVTPRDWRVFWLDALIITSSAVMLTWVTVLQPAFDASRPVVSPLILLTRPIEFIVLVVILIALSCKRQEARRTAMLLMCLGFFAQVSGSWAVGYLIPKGVPLETTRFLADIGFVTAEALYAITPWIAVRGGNSSAPRRPGLADHMLFIAPYLPVLVTLMFIGVATAVGVGMSPEEIYIALGVVAVILLRQFMTMVDNERLLRRLWDHQRTLRHQAYHDPLTGLANRAAFREELDRLLAHPGTEPAVLFVDLDDFKRVNDQYGHAVGDRVLCGIAARLREAVREPDLAARLGGDEFGVLLAEPGQRCDEVGAKLLAELSKPYRVDGVEHTVRASIGLASAADVRHAEDRADHLLRLADSAMYLAKNRGKGSMAVHTAT